MGFFSELAAEKDWYNQIQSITARQPKVDLQKCLAGSRVEAKKYQLLCMALQSAILNPANEFVKAELQALLKEYRHELSMEMDNIEMWLDEIDPSRVEEVA